MVNQYSNQPQFLSKQQREKLKLKQEEQQHNQQQEKSQYIAQIPKDYIPLRSDNHKLRENYIQNQRDKQLLHNIKQKSYSSNKNRSRKLRTYDQIKEKKKILKPTPRSLKIYLILNKMLHKILQYDFNPVYKNRINASVLHSKVQETKILFYYYILIIGVRNLYVKCNQVIADQLEKTWISQLKRMKSNSITQKSYEFYSKYYIMQNKHKFRYKQCQIDLELNDMIGNQFHF